MLIHLSHQSRWSKLIPNARIFLCDYFDDRAEGFIVKKSMLRKNSINYACAERKNEEPHNKILQKCFFISCYDRFSIFIRTLSVCLASISFCWLSDKVIPTHTIKKYMLYALALTCFNVFNALSKRLLFLQNTLLPFACHRLSLLHLLICTCFSCSFGETTLAYMPITQYSNHKSSI